MKLHILSGDIHLIDLKTRMPFKYGIATMTEAPHAFVRLFVDLDGKEESGVSADLLPPKWFTKDPERPIGEEIDEMLLVVEHAVKAAAGIKADSAFDAWRLLWDEQDRWGRDKGFPPLLTHFGTSLVERALIEAVCRSADRPFADLLRANRFGIRLGEIHPELEGHAPADYLHLRPQSHLIARHTVGMADPLLDDDIPIKERLQDGLPHSLLACVRAYGLTHFKVKLRGDAAEDGERLRRVGGLLDAHTGYAWPWLRFTLDGNEHFLTLDDFQEYWTRLSAERNLQRLLLKVVFVEQPFHRSVALSAEALHGLKRWSDRPTLIIDESDADLGSVRSAVALGYHGTSHKNCKGVFKSIANACLIRRKRHGILSGEDLANVGPVALLQDLAVCAALNIDSVERNGHHYFAGLSQFPRPLWAPMLEAHGDLYHPTPMGWPTLTLGHGCLSLASVRAAPFGVQPRIDVEQFRPVAKWKRARTRKKREELRRDRTTESQRTQREKHGENQNIRLNH